jgi:hypothetical protein
MARADASLVRLTVAFNGIVKKGLEPKLPDDMTGDAIPNQVLQHEAALTGRAGAAAGAAGARGQGAEVYDKTRSLLSRVRHAVLASVDDPDDPIIDELGALGVGKNQSDDQVRLANLAVTIAPHVAAGTIAVVPALQPDALKAHADLHLSLTKEKGGATTSHQSVSKSLADERADTREMLGRVKAFLIAQKEPLVDYGFDLPAPPVRPRLERGEPKPAAT